MVLQPLEQCNFVLFLEPLSISPSELAPLSPGLCTLYSVTWSCQELVFPIILQQKIAWTKPSHHDITCTMKSKLIVAYLPFVLVLMHMRVIMFEY